MDRTPGGREVLDFDPNNLPQDYLAAIGLMSAASSSTDDVIETAIAGVLGLDQEQGYAVTCHMSAPQRMSVLRSAAEIHFDNPKRLDLLDDLLNAIQTATEERNRMIHGSWCILPSKGTVFLIQLRARTHVEQTMTPVTVDEIRAAANALYEAGMELHRFVIMAGILPAFPRERERGVNTPKARKAARAKETGGVAGSDSSLAAPDDRAIRED